MEGQQRPNPDRSDAEPVLELGRMSIQSEEILVENFRRFDTGAVTHRRVLDGLQRGL